MAANQGDVYQVSVRYLGTGGFSFNGFGFVAAQAVAGDAQLDLGAAFQTAMIKSSSGGLLYGMNSSYGSTRLEVADIVPGVLATYERSYANVPGSDASDSLPPQCAVVFSLGTALKGRSYRGRFYLPGVCEGSTLAGALTAAATTNYLTISAQLLAVFGPSGSNANWRLAVISRYLNGVERVTPVGTPVTSVTLNTTIYTQRRRVAGYGE